MRHHHPYLLMGIILALMVYAAFSLLRPKPIGLEFTTTDYTALIGWQDDPMVPAFEAFLKSCDKIVRFRPGRKMPGAKVGGRARDWQPACIAAQALMPEGAQKLQAQAPSTQVIRQYFEKYFTPFAVTYDDNPMGKFTGYYEPLLYGSRKQSERYSVPLLARPDELVMVDLGAFRADLKGRRIAGRVVDGRLQPYPDRSAINAGKLKGRTTPIVWVDDPVMAFSLHIQGSGRVQMDDGSMMRVGYAAQNGHPYRSIGRLMVKMGLLKKSEVSMPAIQKWLRDNPDRAHEIMDKNPSYIFLRELSGDGPYGSAGVVLTAKRSLAIDRKHLPLNAPMFLSASHPDPNSRQAPSVPLQQLMITQDTGGAIRGGIRGDVFWGFGPEAEEIAGRMAHSGRYYLLLPKPLAKKVAMREADQDSD